MPIDPARALAAEPTRTTVSWTRRDVLLYHLSLGAGAGTDPEPAYTYEDGLQTLPTFAVVAGQGISAGDAPTAAPATPGIDVALRRLLHAGQGLTVHRPIPAAGTATLTSRVTGVQDKGKAALIVYEHAATGDDGVPLWTTTTRIWARGEGGFGDDPATAPEPELPATPPDREPDLVHEHTTDPRQALLYRLNGDLNPLHADPATARAAGFDRPILHGLATYGMLAKTVTDRVLNGDARRLTSLAVRFAGPFTPGETVRTEIWRTGDDLLLRATCPERGAPVLTHARAGVLR
ncbi:MaoC family dehydratase N-terminal domain-containing protein [Nocardiopsis sp. HNM0947]|uniref:MaoC family dehydratase N-terminal domain-containing protein n=1 Tax=Nocardiopsis coralli TaxID=2772213 RepID=A0ABR9PEV8_9ACTN|nr:MaoC/PaaZ C-terminal domain-containing protein [Nocardiopsis coralli]MBE3002381.1 MaoC family dehydratase N-terminal domain-containing protein [Nocardiopsis coralli]